MVLAERPGRFHSQLAVAVGSFIAFLALRTTLDSLVSIHASVLLTPSVGLAVPLGVAFGFPAAIGLVSGALVAQVAQFGLTGMAVFEGLSLLVLALVSSLVWQSEIQVTPGTTLHVRGVSGITAVTVVGSVGSASVLAWGGELLGLYPFYVAFFDGLMRFLVATAVVGPVVLVVFSLFDDRTTRLHPPGPSHRLGRSFVLVPFAWATLALVGSVGFGIRQRLPQGVYEHYGVEFLYHLVHPDVFGQGGRRAQVVFGALMLVAWAIAFRRTRLAEPQDDSSTSVHDDESVRSSLDSEKTTVSSRSEEMEVR